MESLLPIIGLVLGVLVVNDLAGRVKLSAPILLVVAGFAVSFIPGVPAYQIAPGLVLTVLLPPLLFGAAFESSAVAIRQLLRPIFQLAVVLVLLTAFTVALVLRIVLPDLPFAAALALGAIVAPPDAVAAVTVARRVGLPRQLVTVLEGESLFNDATALVTFKVAVTAIGASSLAWAPAAGEFAWAAVGGLLIGMIFGWLLSFIRRRARSALTVTVLSLVSPFAAYLLGEEAHASGVIVVVVSGLILGHRSPTEIPAAVRLTEAATWAALRYGLEGAVFGLIGLQLREIVSSLDTDQPHVYLAIVAVLVTVVVSRPVWLFLIHLVVRVSPRVEAKTTPRGVAALSWAGMRGVVSLAAAQSLPVDTPYRSLLLVCTIAVIIATLVLQGLSLPWVIRRLGVTEDHRQDDLKARADAHAQTNVAINAKVDELVEQHKLSDRQAELMRKWASLRDWRNWDDDDKSREFGHRLSVMSDWRRSLLGIERSVIVAMRNDGNLAENVLQEMQRDLDLEEALLERRTQAVDGHLEELPDEAEHAAPDDRADAAADRETAEATGMDGTGPELADPENSEPAIDDAEIGAMLSDESHASGDQKAGPSV